MLQFEYSNGLYFVDLPVFCIDTIDEKIANPYRYFKFENRDEWFRTDLARPIKDNYSYYPYLKKYLDKKFNIYLRKQKLEKIGKK